MHLYPFQEVGRAFLLGHPQTLLADDMGLGKTVQVARALSELTSAGVVRRTLIVAPVSICLNWKSELAAWAPELPSVLYQGGDRFGMLRGHARVLIGSYETIVRDLAQETHDGTDFVDLGLDVIVLDEAQKIKTLSSTRARVLSRILAPRRWALTGTPLENHPRELASILHFLFPNELTDAHDVSRDLPSVARLRDATMLRRTKEVVASDLPEKTVGYVPVAMTPVQDAEYCQLVAQLKEAIRGNQKPSKVRESVLGALQNLRRAASISSDGSSGKLDFLEEELSDLQVGAGKAVIFSSFPNLVFPSLSRRLSHLSPVVLTGKMSSQERAASHTRFTQDDSCQIMLASLGAGGVGYTWTVARFGYHVDLWWNPQLLHQADDRLHRIGQAHPVMIKRLVSEGTLESGIRDMLHAKEEIFDFLVDRPTLDHTPGGISKLLEVIGLNKLD